MMTSMLLKMAPSLTSENNLLIKKTECTFFGRWCTQIYPETLIQQAKWQNVQICCMTLLPHAQYHFYGDCIAYSLSLRPQFHSNRSGTVGTCHWASAAYVLFGKRPPLPLVRNRTHFRDPNPPSPCVHTKWMTP